MARPKTKADLLKAANTQYDKLLKLIDSMSKKELETPFCFDKSKKEAHWQRDKNLRDVLAHLYEWHKLLLIWIQANSQGEEQHFLPQPYTWKTYAKMNMEFWEKHQKTPLDTAKELFAKSHKEALKIIDTYSNEELFSKAYFKWTGTTSLGSYCVSATSSHYEWAIKKLRVHSKNCKNST